MGATTESTAITPRAVLTGGYLPFRGWKTWYETAGDLKRGVPLVLLTATQWGTKDFYVEDPDGYVVCFGGRPAAG